MVVTTGRRVVATTIDGDRVHGVRASWELILKSWPATRVVLLQIGLATVSSVAIASMRHDAPPFFAAIFAVAATEFICARHHRRMVEILFGVAVGLLVSAMINPSWLFRHALSDALIGCAVALLVAIATTPRDPAKLVRTETDPLLGQLSVEVRSVARALRTGDVDAAADSVKALNQAERGLRALNETLVQVRRSAPLTKWLHGLDLPRLTSEASEVAEAVGNIRSMARRAWWGVLRAEQPVPAALPQMVEALADGTALLRIEVAEGVQPVKARQMLASSAQWGNVLREENITLSAAAVAAKAEAAALSLLVSTGLTEEQAEALARSPIEI